MSEPAHNLETQSGDDLLADLADDFLRRYRAGEQPSVNEYAKRHPTLEGRIRELFPAAMMMEQQCNGETRDFEPSSERVGAIIGRYKLLERIGEGGFGVVYMAEQQHPIRRKVALKVIKPGFDTRQVIARFEAERQALALMDHESIARVLDAGATDSGRPYFVMELVHGVPITDFCDKNQLPTRERLELFVPVCRAVQHAHTKGIIHRDIKPTNVLVTLHEGVPVPKVIDFGVAKATGQQLTEKTLFTNFAQMVGTPLYMSPEQAEMTGIDVDTRSDVYSLGVLLYELLTGTTPLDKDRIKQAAFDEVRRIIREEEPPTPSIRLSTMGKQARSISARRKSDPKQVGQVVRGELDWIVMKALEKNRSRRYETPNALARDIEHYLRDEPVEACPPSVWYRFRKFARRRKAVLAAVSGILLMVIVAVGMLAVTNVQVSGALERERRNSYSQRIALANREWSANNLSGMEALLHECPDDLRGWEWHYLKRLRYSTLNPLRQESIPLSVAFSPDGQYLATATQAGVLRLWKASTGKECRKWTAHRKTVNSVAFSPDGRYLASGSYDGMVKVWDMKKILQGDFSEPLLQLPLGSRVWCVSFSPDSQRLAAAAGRTVKQYGEAQIWDVNSRRQTLILHFSDRAVCVQFSPDGRRLATLTGSSLQLWDTETGREQLTCRGDPDENLWTLAFSPDGRQIAAVGGQLAVYPDRNVKVWDAHSGQLIWNLSGHVGGLKCVAFSPDGRRIASAGLDQTVKLWDTATGEEVLTLRGHLDQVYSMAFSPDGRQLASASLDNTVRIWDATPLKKEPTPEYRTLRGHTGAVTNVAFHPTDALKLVSAGTDGTVRLWDVKSGGMLGTLDVPPSVQRVSVAYSPNGESLAVTSVVQSAPVVSIWNTATNKQTRSFGDQLSADSCVAFSPDGRYLASAGFDWVVRIRDVTTGKQLPPLEGHAWPIFGLAFSPDGRYLASCSSDNTVRIWDWTNSKLFRTLEPAHEGRVTSVAFSPDGKLLASASWDRTIKVWDSATWKLLDEVPDPTGGVLCVAFGPDRRLVWGSTDGTVKVWDGPDQELHVLRGHTSWVQAVSVNADGTQIASASLDGTVKVWRAPPEQSVLDETIDDAEN